MVTCSRQCATKVCCSNQGPRRRVGCCTACLYQSTCLVVSRRQSVDALVDAHITHMSIRLLSAASFTNQQLNTGGGAWNHALYFKHLAPATSPQADPSKSVSKELSAAVDSSFGGFDQMVAEVKTAAGKVFGSGWAWVCYTGEV